MNKSSWKDKITNKLLFSKHLFKTDDIYKYELRKLMYLGNMNPCQKFSKAPFYHTSKSKSNKNYFADIMLTNLGKNLLKFNRIQLWNKVLSLTIKLLL